MIKIFDDKIDDVSIIILNWNGKKFLGSFLDEAIKSALNQDYTNIEVIFADNGSTDNSVHYVRNKYGSFLQVIELYKNYGPCLGNNIAFKQIKPSSEYILFMNNDVILSRNYVKELVKTMKNDKNIGVIQGLEISKDPFSKSKIFKMGGFLDSFGRIVNSSEYYSYIFNKRFRAHAVNFPILWAIGAAMMIKKEVLELIRGFSPEFFIYFGDVDLCIRVLCKGYKILGTNRTSYFHKDRGTTSKFSWLSWYFIYRNRWLLVIRYYPLDYLIKSILSFTFEFVKNIMESLKQHQRERPRLMIKALWYLIRNFRRELKVRYLYSPARTRFKKFIINKPLTTRARG